MAPERLLSIVIPVYRSQGYLAATVNELVSFLDARAPFEVILVNDGSPDDVQRVIDELVRGDRRIRALRLGKNLGQHRATLQGLCETRGGTIVTIDDDGQNPPSAVLAVRDRLEREDLDVVYGEFEASGQSLSRRVASSLNRWVSRHTLPNERNIAISNVRALRGDLARQLGSIGSSYAYIDAMIFRMAGRIGAVKVEHRRREAGSSSYTFGKLLSLWLSHVTTLSVLPLRLAMVGAFGVSGLGFLLGVAATARALYRSGAPLGWLSLFCAVTFLFSVLFAFLGVVSAYLGRLYVSSNERGMIWVRSRSPDAPDAPDARNAIDENLASGP